MSGSASLMAVLFWPTLRVGVDALSGRYGP